MKKCLVILLTVLLAPIKQEELCAEELIQELRKNYKNWAEANGIDIATKIYETTTKRTESEESEQYDFVIVGVGSSGSVLVNRLSENSKWKILALEAGDEPDFLSDVPAFTMLQQFTQYNWGYVTEKQDNISLGFKNQRLSWPRGKGLGGTSLINYMFHTKCNKMDYDKWASMGNDGWSYEDISPYLENNDLSVEYLKFRTKCAEMFVEAAEQLGYAYVNVNGSNQFGVDFAQTDTKDGFRCSAEKAFVRPVKTRENLILRRNSHVTKVLVDETTKTATGVRYVHKGMTYTAKATKEVILCSGTIGSPHILMLSGIGPRKNLEEHDIHVIQDLPVGQKLLDHPGFIGLTFSLNKSITFDFDKASDARFFEQLHKEGRGPLQSTASAEALLFMKTQAANDYPDVELMLLSSHFSTDRGLISKRAMRLSEQVYNEVYKPLENKPVYTILTVLLHPKSFGRMELQSADPFIYPKLYANYLSDPEGQDLKTLVAGIREAVRIGESPVMRKFGSELVRTKLPGCKSMEFDSEDYWSCAVRHLTTTMSHQTTTCKMGPPEDHEAVVDQRLRVHNVKNLRVADTSVIPISFSGHTNTPAYVIGKKAAAIIKEQWS